MKMVDSFEKIPLEIFTNEKSGSEFVAKKVAATSDSSYILLLNPLFNRLFVFDTSSLQASIIYKTFFIPDLLKILTTLFNFTEVLYGSSNFVSAVIK